MAEFETIEHDVLIIGVGGAGLRAAIEASSHGVSVGLVCKSLLGKAHTVMAEGGIQAAVDPNDSPQKHYNDTYASGHCAGEPALVAQMAMDGPDVIRWLIQLGMQFDLEGEDLSSNLRTRQAGGKSTTSDYEAGDVAGRRTQFELCLFCW